MSLDIIQRVVYRIAGVYSRPEFIVHNSNTNTTLITHTTRGYGGLYHAEDPAGREASD